LANTAFSVNIHLFRQTYGLLVLVFFMYYTYLQYNNFQNHIILILMSAFPSVVSYSYEWVTGFKNRCYIDQ
jgi:hypothetical protein